MREMVVNYINDDKHMLLKAVTMLVITLAVLYELYNIGYLIGECIMNIVGLDIINTLL